MASSIAPEFDLELDNKHHSTPQKAGLFAIIAWEKYKALQPPDFKPNTANIASFLGLPQQSAQRIQKRGGSSRKRENDPNLQETRGRKNAITKEKAARIHHNLQNGGFEARSMTWGQLGRDAEVPEVTDQTVQTRMKKLYNYSTRIACERTLIEPSSTRLRLRFALSMLRKYPTPADWRRVRFSDEVHFSYGPEGKVRVKRMPGERANPDCMYRKEKSKKDPTKYRAHGWAAIGYNFKSPFLFYTTKATNGKMTHKNYIDQILEIGVKQWIERGDDFVLEEDGDSSHGPSDKNPVRTWKEENGGIYC